MLKLPFSHSCFHDKLHLKWHKDKNVNYVLLNNLFINFFYSNYKCSKFG